MKIEHPYRRRSASVTRRRLAPGPPDESPQSHGRALPGTGIPVRDHHAMLQYLERFEGVDIRTARERFSQRLSAGNALQLIRLGRNSKHRIRGDGDTVCLSEGRIVARYP